MSGTSDVVPKEDVDRTEDRTEELEEDGTEALGDDCDDELEFLGIIS